MSGPFGGPDGDKRFVAAVDMVRRSGADSIELRYCDGHDEPADDDEPVTVVWMAIAHWPERVTDAASAVPGAIMPEHFDACAGMTPWRAIFRLCEASMDGGVCLHCGRPTAIDDKPADEFLAATEDFVCWYRFDPELATFRRMCEGFAA